MNRFATFLASWAAAYGTYTQYRVAFLMYLVMGAAPLIMMFAWMSLAEAGATGAVSANWFAGYFLVVYLTRQLNAIWLIRELDEQVRLGRLSGHLLQPVDPYWRFLSWHCADIAVRMPIVLVFVPVALWLSGGYQAISVEHLPLYLASAVIGVLLHFHLEYLMGLAAFWTDQSLALEDLYYTLFYLLGGLVVPLDMFPEAIRSVVALLPWPYVFGFPTEVAVGTRTGTDLLHGLGMQLGWLLVLAVAGRIAWRRGLRRYGASGG